MDFNTEGEQWAAVFGGDYHWVMIGQKYQNSATTCMDSKEGNGVSSENANRKYIMCCSF